LRFSHDLHRPENSGLDWAIEKIEEIKEEGNHITHMMSHADLIQLGGYAAVEYTGGPVMLFRMGRNDADPNKEHTPEERLPDAREGKNNILNKMLRMGFSL
jgi:catalase (peroxidase I)